MKLKGRRQSKNVEDVRSPVSNILVSNQNKRDFPDSMTPFGPQTDLSPRERYRSSHASVEAKGPFKQMVDGMDDSAKRFSKEQAKKRVTGPNRSRMDTSTVAPDKNGKLRTIVRPRRRTKD